MEQTFQTTSFIPKKPLTIIKKPASRGVGILTALTGLIFLGTVAVTGGIVFYKKKLQSDVELKKVSLNKAQAAFDPTSIESLKALDKRIDTSDTILSNHITVSPIIVNVLNNNTLRRIQYTQFSHTVSGSGANAKIQVKLSGKAESLPYVALQSKQLSTVKYVGNPIFSDIITAKDNSVTFNLSFDVKPDLIIFSRLIDQLSAGVNTIDPSSMMQPVESINPTTNK